MTANATRALGRDQYQRTNQPGRPRLWREPIPQTDVPWHCRNPSSLQPGPGVSSK